MKYKPEDMKICWNELEIKTFACDDIIKAPWYVTQNLYDLPENHPDYSDNLVRVNARTMVGTDVVFHLNKGSSFLKKILDCDPFGESLISFTLNRDKPC